MDMFGHTNEVSILEAAKAYRDAAIADGWSHKPIYSCEEESRACDLSKDGFTMTIYTRDYKDMKWHYEVSVNIWGPDGLAVVPPDTYDFAAIKAATTTCNYCGKVNVPTFRVGFAGRSCENCLPEQKKKSEFRGWTS